jgi:hypothetical protein
MGKRGTDLDWIIDDSPDDSRADPKPVRLGLRVVQRAIRVAPRQPSFFRRHRRRLLVLGGALLAVFIGAYGIYWLGWQRVRASLIEQIVYEDARSIAGDVDAVLGVQAAGDDAWLNWRAAQVGLGQASLPPAETLVPLPRAPRLLRLDVHESGRFDAVVLRDFSDSFGQSYTFEYPQRYHQLSPGVWERLPPGTASLIESRHWAGLHISATFPLADERWMLAALPKIDGALHAACIDWSCPPGSVVPVLFLGQLPALPLGGDAPTYRPSLRLLSLQLAGYPHDEAASQALSRAITSRLLEQLAVGVAGANRYARNPYLDALVARAEIRLKLAPALAEPLVPADFAAPALLWPRPAGAHLAENHPGQRPRQQAVRFLNDLLPRFPRSAEAALLAQAGRASSLANWLSNSLSIDGQAAIDGWSKNAAGQVAASAPARWDDLHGLAYACPAGAWLVRGAQPERLPLDPAAVWLTRAAVSPDGRWLATSDHAGANVTLLDLSASPAHASQLPAGPGRHLWSLGWMPNGQLALADNLDFQFVFGVNYQFELLDPATMVSTHLGSLLLVPANWPLEQPAVAGKLAISLVEDAGDPPGPVVHPAALTLASPLRLQVPADQTSLQPLPVEQALPDQGFSQSLSPDGRWLAYLPSEEAPPGRPWPPAHVTLFDTLTQQSFEVLVSESVADGELLHDATGLTWLPDGSGLVFIVRTDDARTRLMRLSLDPNNPAAGADASEIPTPISIAYLAGISSDNHYLAAAVPADIPVELMVVDLATNKVVARAALAPGAQLGGVWSPSGHHLAVQGPAGLYVIDPATNEQQWITSGACQPAWYDLRANH